MQIIHNIPINVRADRWELTPPFLLPFSKPFQLPPFSLSCTGIGVLLKLSGVLSACINHTRPYRLQRGPNSPLWEPRNGNEVSCNRRGTERDFQDVKLSETKGNI
ncbi:hypothetical protein CEXT_58631 [Caerostris extrusa]|uniref:Ycf15 n=1 Tax=Caerostris extrusa TaxID=172846 RepID=A0AAV4W2G4_CAEEX|nr:hypothetical protein CEXT_58631 [Caerostris extrusa]